MPYVAQEARAELETRKPENAGELNYVLTMILAQNDIYSADAGIEDLLWFAITDYLDRKDRESYGYYNEVIGVLRCAELEHLDRHWVGAWLLSRLQKRLYAERVRPYEDTKIAENGDIPRRDNG